MVEHDDTAHAVGVAKVEAEQFGQPQGLEWSGKWRQGGNKEGVPGNDDDEQPGQSGEEAAGVFS